MVTIALTQQPHYHQFRFHSWYNLQCDWHYTTINNRQMSALQSLFYHFHSVIWNCLSHFFFSSFCFCWYYAVNKKNKLTNCRNTSIMHTVQLSTSKFDSLFRLREWIEWNNYEQSTEWAIVQWKVNTEQLMMNLNVWLTNQT